MSEEMREATSEEWAEWRRNREWTGEEIAELRAERERLVNRPPARPNGSYAKFWEGRLRIIDEILEFQSR